MRINLTITNSLPLREESCADLILLVGKLENSWEYLSKQDTRNTNLAKNKMDDLHGTEITAVLIYPRKYLIMEPENNVELLNVYYEEKSFLI